MNISQYIIKIRRHIHQFPEIGYETFNTAKYIKDLMTDLGYVCYDIINKAGVIAKLELGKDQTIAFRADIDALNLQECTNLSYKSSNNFMHACGHDAHTAIMIGAAKEIIEQQDKIKSNICFIFQPAEEGPLPGGAIKTIESGLLNNIDFCWAFHVTNLLNSGELGLKMDEAFAAPDLFEGKIIGQGCHASTPHLGINPIIPLCEIVKRFQSLNDEFVNKELVVITTTQLHAGTAKNIIPYISTFNGTTRCFKKETRTYLDKTMNKIVKDIADIYGATSEFEFQYGYDPVINHKEAANILLSSAKKILGDEKVKILTTPQMVGEDFSYYSKIAKSAIAWIGVKGVNQDFFDLHSPNFILDENSLLNAAKIVLDIALNYQK